MGYVYVDFILFFNYDILRVFCFCFFLSLSDAFFPSNFDLDE